MKILVIAATSAEIAPLISKYGLNIVDNFASHADFDLLISGVGMTATAFSLGRYLSKEYSLILNLGIAGSFSRELELGSVVLVVQDVFSELGAEDGEDFLDIDSLGFGQSQYRSHSSYSDDPGLSILRKTKAITVNRVHGSEDSINRVVKRLGPDIESMEGAAVFYCAEQWGIPCIQVRAISNYVERRNRERWEIGLAISNLNIWAINFLTKR